MENLVIVILLVALLGIWVRTIQRKLMEMNENVNIAMNQLGVQISSCLDAVNELLKLATKYSALEAQMLIEMIKSRRSRITEQSIPEDVIGQEGIIAEVMGYVDIMAEQHPELKADKDYRRCIGAVDSYKKMRQTGRLIYNDSVEKLNQAIRSVPTYLIAGILGFHQRDYLESINEKIH